MFKIALCCVSTKHPKWDQICCSCISTVLLLVNVGGTTSEVIVTVALLFEDCFILHIVQLY